MRTVIILLAVIALLLIIRTLYRQSSPNLRKIGFWLAAILGGGLFLFLLATGRLHWLFAVGAAALPVIYRLLPLIRYVPLLRNLYRRYQAKQAGVGTTGAAGSQTSTVQSRFLRMTLHHDSGDMDGEILQGQFTGQRLQQLGLEQLFSLLQECQQDQDSLSLLMAYLDRVHPDWREQAGTAGASHNEYSADETNSKMSLDEAYEILGLSPGASKSDIKSAHRRLMQKLHPDHGGSTYLAAKINLAKDVLLKQV